MVFPDARHLFKRIQPPANRPSSPLWPVERVEYPLFFSILILFFLLALNYHLLNMLQSNLLVTAPGAGTQALPFIKIALTLPAAWLVASSFTYAAQRFSRSSIFYTTLSLFTLYFLLFLCLLYPYRELVQPTSWVDYLTPLLPVGYQGALAVLRYWPYASFYVAADLWSSAMIWVAFWGLIGDVIPPSQAKRFYPLLMLSASLSSTLAGSMTPAITRYSLSLPGYASGWEQTLGNTLLLIVVINLLILGLFALFHHSSFQTAQLKKTLEAGPPPTSWTGMLGQLRDHRLTLALAGIVFSYYFFFHHTELLWASEVAKLNPTAQGFHSYVSQVKIYSGICSILCALLLSSPWSQKLPWSQLAVLPPYLMLATTALFFWITYTTQQGGWLALASTALPAFLASTQHVFGRAMKDTLLSSSKEIALLSLDPTTRIRAKAIIDGFVSRLGKILLSALYACLLLFLPMEQALLWMTAISACSLLLWLYCAKEVGHILHKSAPTLER